MKVEAERSVFACVVKGVRERGWTTKSASKRIQTESED